MKQFLKPWHHDAAFEYYTRYGIDGLAYAAVWCGMSRCYYYYGTAGFSGEFIIKQSAAYMSAESALADADLSLIKIGWNFLDNSPLITLL